MAQRSLLVRALWFVVVGWWATPLVVNLAWLLNATIVLLPLGIKLINLVPTVLTLREPRSLVDPDSAGSGQRSLVVRAVYFVFVGWWLSWLWANVAAFLAVTIVGLPIAVWMFNRLPYVTSLYRFDG
ncbi:YccF domain-containing protein [Salinigranum salinum]|uniref:YccF domain-containing protein n=1 Tax=Salinigranum salinum TaxID=1364937 RepID=UPI001260DFCC|nr:YccF domain-containing protein [Salinigranum salinum]